MRPGSPRSGCRTARCRRRTPRRPWPGRARSRRGRTRACHACPCGFAARHDRTRSSTSSVHSSPIACEHVGHDRLRGVDEPVVVDVHERAAAGGRLGDVERHEPVDVLAHQLEHVASDLFGVGVGRGRRRAACGRGCSWRPKPAPDRDGSRRSTRRGSTSTDGVEREQVARPLQRPAPRRCSPLQQPQHPPRGTRRRRGRSALCEQEVEVARQPTCVQSSPGLTKVWSRIARHSCGPSTSVRCMASILPPGRLARRRACSMLSASPPPGDRFGVDRGRRHRPVAFPGAQHAERRILVEQVLEVGGSGTRQPGEEDGRLERDVVDLRDVGDVAVDLHAVANSRLPDHAVDSRRRSSPCRRSWTRRRRRGSRGNAPAAGPRRACGPLAYAFDDVLRRSVRSRRFLSGVSRRARARISTLALVGVPGGQVGSVNAVCGTRRRARCRCRAP